jgi:uncharacterized protein
VAAGGRLGMGKRLIKSPKEYYSDSGLFHQVMGLETRENVLGHPCAGASWEGFALQQLRAVIPDDKHLMYWRTAAGAEIDVLVLKSGRPIIAIECKMNATNPRPRKGFMVSCNDLNIDERWVAYPGDTAFEIAGNVMVLPLGEIIDRLQEKTR